MWNEPNITQLSQLPSLYSTEDRPLEDKIVHIHFFIGGCDWYVVEYDKANRLFFGFAILNNDLDNAEWGYISFDELKELSVPPGVQVDNDLYWQPTPARDIPAIKLAMGWR